MTTMAPFKLMLYADRIKEWYNHIYPYMVQKKGMSYVNPYPDTFNWAELFTPIEEQAWHALRNCGQAPMYPQYPVGKYWVDFGNPILKIAIECDGKEFHQDTIKDAARDLELSKMGWMVYRISGSHCFKSPPDYVYTDGEIDESEMYNALHEFYMETIEGLVRAIAVFYFELGVFRRHDREIDLAYKCLEERVSLPDNESINRFEKVISDRYSITPKYVI